MQRLISESVHAFCLWTLCRQGSCEACDFPVYWQASLAFVGVHPPHRHSRVWLRAEDADEVPVEPFHFHQHR